MCNDVHAKEILQTQATTTIISSQRATAKPAARLQTRRWCRGGAENSNTAQTTGPPGCSGKHFCFVLGSDGFRNAVTTATTMGQLDGCKEKHQCQTQ